MLTVTDPQQTDSARCPFSGAAVSATAQTATDAPVNAPVNAGPSAEGASTSAAVETSVKPRPDEPTPAPPSDLAVFYDPLSYAAYDHPYELYKVLREKAPVYYNARRDLYVVSRYADVRAGLNNFEQLSSALGNDMDGTHESYGAGNLIMVDRPDHTRLRSAVRRVFVGREILAKEDGVRQLAQQLLAELQEKGGGEFATEVALPLVIGAATKLVGLPTEDGPLLQDHLLRSMVRIVGEYGVPADASVSNHEAEEHLEERFAQRTADIEAGGQASGSDAITQLIAAAGNGKVESDEQVGLAHLLISAAIDAPAALLTNLVAVLDKFPAFQSYLAENPDQIEAFVTESIRFDTPGQNLCRQTTTEITIAGTTIPANSRVMFLLASANRDERVFENPDFFDITREFARENRIMSFGDGIHACMGEPLARLVGRVLVETLVQGPEIRIVGVPERWAKQMVRGFSQLPVKFID